MPCPSAKTLFQPSKLIKRGGPGGGWGGKVSERLASGGGIVDGSGCTYKPIKKNKLATAKKVAGSAWCGLVEQLPQKLEKTKSQRCRERYRIHC